MARVLHVNSTMIQYVMKHIPSLVGLLAVPKINIEN